MLACTAQAKMKWSLPSPACCSFNEDTWFFWSAYSLSGVQYSMINSSSCFKKCNRNLDPDFCKVFFPQNFLYIIGYLSTWSSDGVWGVIAASHHSFSRWWSNTLWVTLRRLWPHKFFLCSFWFCWFCHNCHLQSLIGEFIYNLMDMHTADPKCLYLAILL